MVRLTICPTECVNISIYYYFTFHTSVSCIKSFKIDTKQVELFYLTEKGQCGKKYKFANVGEGIKIVGDGGRGSLKCAFKGTVSK